MRLIAKIINSDWTLNSWKVIGTLDFQPGETSKLVMRLFDNAEDLRYIPLSTTIMTVTFNTTTGTLDRVATLNADDRSFAEIQFTAAEMSTLIGGNAIFTLDEVGDGSVINKGIARNALSKIDTDC